jgi:peroxiredoxin (alkyl hydroperoxide reductase subunit C)
VQILAISVDHPYALKSWAANEGFDFPLLSDFWPHGAISRAYGVFNDDHGMAVRGTFLVDKAGKVRFAEINGPGEPRDQSAWLNAVTAVAKDV